VLLALPRVLEALGEAGGSYSDKRVILQI
jgi:hypothetical protein